jgi:hypothetical protein
VPSSPAIWTNQAKLIQLPTDTVTSVIATTDQWVKSIDSTLDVLSGLIDIASKFTGSASDLVIDFIKNYANASITALRDLLSLGGAGIIITPYNRMNKEWYHLVPDKEQPLKVRSMTPRSAFNEFYASFDNTNDPNRPIWTDATKVTGMGFLVTTANIGSLCEVCTALSMLFNFKEFTDLGSKYTTSISNWTDSVSKDGGDYLSTFSDKGNLKFDISGFPNGEHTKQPNVFQGDDKNIAVSLLASDSTFAGSLHWYGLNLNNFTWLKNTVDVLEELSKKLVELLNTADNAIKSLLLTLKRKIMQLKDLIDKVYKLIKGIVVSLASEGLASIYTFNVPEDYGGVNYIKNSIQLSLTTPTTDTSKKVKSLMDSSPFSVLFFMGTSTGTNTASWKAMFDKSWNATLDDFNKFDRMLNPPFTVLPITEGKTFSFGDSITIKVLSQDSTDTTPMYFDYQLRDNDNSIMHEFKNTDLKNFGSWAKVNKSSFPIILDYSKTLNDTKPISTTYNLNVQVYDALGVTIGESKRPIAITSGSPHVAPSRSVVITSTTPYSVNFLTGICTIVDDNHPVIIIPTSTPSNKTYSSAITASIVDAKSGAMTEEVFISANATGMIGYTLSADSRASKLKIVNSIGGTLLLDIINHKGKSSTLITNYPLSPSYKFKAFPAVMFIDFGSNVSAMKVCTGTGANKVCKTIYLPNSLQVDGDTNYEYYLCVDGEWIGPFNFSTTTRVLDGTVICG